MAWLLIDNSNNRTKFALGDKQGLHSWRGIIKTSELSPTSLEELLAGVNYEQVVCASVVPAKARLLADFFSTPFHLLTYQSPLDLEFDLPHPEQIGNDRLANTFALKETYGFPAIAIDFGTAVTFSVLSDTGKFSGGVIAPGMDLMTSYLAARTAQLPKIDIIQPESCIGKTTITAMQAGATIGQRGMVREILAELTREIGGNPRVVATGGGAEFIGSQLPEIHVIDPDLTLEGLRLLAEKTA